MHGTRVSSAHGGAYFIPLLYTISNRLPMEVETRHLPGKLRNRTNCPHASKRVPLTVRDGKLSPLPIRVSSPVDPAAAIGVRQASGVMEPSNQCVSDVGQYRLSRTWHLHGSFDWQGWLMYFDWQAWARRPAFRRCSTQKWPVEYALNDVSYRFCRRHHGCCSLPTWRVGTACSISNSYPRPEFADNASRAESRYPSIMFETFLATPQTDKQNAFLRVPRILRFCASANGYLPSPLIRWRWAPMAHSKTRECYDHVKVP